MKAGGVVNAYVTEREEISQSHSRKHFRRYCITLPTDTCTNPINGWEGEVVMGAGRFEYLQSKITCLASFQPPGSQLKDSEGGGGKSFHSMGGKVQ